MSAPFAVPPGDGACPLDALEEGVLELVLSKLPPRDVASLACASAGLRGAVSRASLRVRVDPEPLSRRDGSSKTEAEAMLAAAESSGYSGPSSGKPSKKMGANSAAPPMPASWQLVATAVAVGSMKA